VLDVREHLRDSQIGVSLFPLRALVAAPGLLAGRNGSAKDAAHRDQASGRARDPRTQGA
jgi:hypothetical protein